MGMFDNIRCHYPLPDGFTGDLEYQTKDTPMQFLEHYTITEDGRLIHHYVDREWVEDETRPIFKGSLAPIESSREDREVPFHGDIEFYASNVCASGPEGIATENDEPPFWRSYTARFTNDRVQWIRGGLQEGYHDRPHLTRAELHEKWRLAQEERERERAKDPEGKNREGGIHSLRILTPGALDDTPESDGGEGGDGGGGGE